MALAVLTKSFLRLSSVVDLVYLLYPARDPVPRVITGRIRAFRFPRLKRGREVS